MPTDREWDALTEAARRAARAAYAPYSRFRVGAAVRSVDGAVFAGCNVENASYGLTVCAERNAIFQAIAAGARRIDALVVYTPTPSPTTPCGACRQVLLEFGDDAEVLCVCDGAARERYAAGALLPDAFRAARP
jgi:cytidine deaminase